MAVTVHRALTAIEEHTKQLIYDNLRLGDIVVEGQNNLAVVIKKTNGWVHLLILAGSSYHFLEIFDLTYLRKFLSYEFYNGCKITELVAEFEQKLEWAHTWHTWRIDNLTYIEILARLRENERSI
jgi:hypothetical protein